MTHAPEPWTIAERTPSRVETPFGAVSIAWFDNAGMGSEQNAEDTARRIVACVNACAGIPTEALEAGVVKEMRELLIDMRNSLRNALPEIACLRDAAGVDVTANDKEADEEARARCDAVNAVLAKLGRQP